MADPTFRLDDDGRHVIWEHDCLITWTTEPGDQELVRSEMTIPLNPEHGWTVVSTEPLTVTPSLLCTGCGTHGFITDGHWVSV